MNFLIAAIMRRLYAPNHEISCSRHLWSQLLFALRERGYNGKRESGAFLLGKRLWGRARISEFVLYDDLDPHCLDSGIVRFDGRYFGALWEKCRQLGINVVADVHTHPGEAYQSGSDRANPMISQRGHVAFILPRFAEPPVRLKEIGIYLYHGSKQWSAIAVNRRETYLHIGF